MDGLELTEGAIRERRGAKWRKYPDHVLPAWVAEMDFPVAEPIQRVVRRVVEMQDYGYPWREEGNGVEHAFADRMRALYGWQPEPEQVQLVGNLVQAMTAAIFAFSRPGDGVLVQTPVYPPFLGTIEATRRRRVVNPLVDDGTRYQVDLDGLAQAIDDGTRILMLCSPHNPTGRVLERAELEAIGNLAVERDLVIVCDEIHSDLVFPGRRHVPLVTLGEEVAARTVTITSATKGFNIPGLCCGLMHFGSAALLDRFREALPEWLLGHPTMMAMDATIAAWREGEPWLEAVMERLLENRDRVAAWAAATPGIRHHRPEATYLAWLDCRDLDLPGPSAQEFFLEEARVGLSPGQDFQPEGGEGFVRLNFATSPVILERLLERMTSALRGRL
jgi:cysteine-S-conjugate beta-lyase